MNDENKPSEGEKPLDNAAVARSLGALMDTLKTQTTIDDTTAIGEARQEALLHVEEDVGEGVEIREGEELPKWATSDIPNLDKIFVPPSPEEIKLWEPAVDTTSRRAKGKLQVSYKRGTESLDPGTSKAEQGIDLDAIDNFFTIDEWKTVVQPLLDRLSKVMEIKRFMTLETKTQEKLRNRIKRLLPEAFPDSDLENLSIEKLSIGKIDKLEENEAKERKAEQRKVRDRIWGMIEEVLSNPEILERYIKDIFEGEEKPESEVHKADRFAKKKIKQSLSRLLKDFQSEEDKQEYVEELSDKIAQIAEQLLYLNLFHSEGIYKPEKVKAEFEESPYMKFVLEEMTVKAARQLKHKRGMVSIVGDMGTGKNFVVEHWSAKTNRPFFYFPCKRGMDAAELGFHFELKKGESIVVPSQLAKGLQTPNAVILIDEPNSLDPEVVAALHGLADHNRKLVYNGVSFNVAPGVVIMMAMNPATYDHVKDYPQAASDRNLGQVIKMGYPPHTELDKVAYEEYLTKQEKETKGQEENSLIQTYVCDEALILRNEVPELKVIETKEFAKIWDVVVNGKSDTILSSEIRGNFSNIEHFVKGIFDILEITNKWRTLFQSQDMDRTISIRGAIAVTEEFKRIGDVKKAFINTYNANSEVYDGGPDDYEMLQELIEEHFDSAVPASVSDDLLNEQAA